MKITLGTTYYENPENLHNFLNRHSDFFDEIIVVDDGSSIHPIEKQQINFPNVKIYKVLKDYGFNSHGCRNLIADQATNDWIVFLDCDRFIADPNIFIKTIEEKKLQSNCRYRFEVHVMEIGNGIHGSVNDFLINKSHFFSVGGYDEELIGIRDGDRFFFKQLLNFGVEKILHGCVIVANRGPSLKNNSIIKSTNDQMNLSIIQEKTKKISYREFVPEPNKKILTFEWKKLI